MFFNKFINNWQNISGLLSNFKDNLKLINNEYRLTPISKPLREEIRLAKKFWSNYPMDSYYQNFQPQTQILLDNLSDIAFKNIFEFGCNMGRNLYFVKEFYPNAKIYGVDVNKKAIREGRKLFGFDKHVLIEGDELYLKQLKSNSFDVVFTISVLDHLPEIEKTLKNLLRIAKKRVILIELVFPKIGTFASKEVVPFSYSHNYLKLLAKISSEHKFKIITQKKVHLGPGILRYYHLYVLQLKKK